MHRAFSIILLARGISKQCNSLVTRRIVNHSSPSRDDVGANFLETVDDADKIFRIHSVSEPHQTNKLARQRCQLPPFRLALLRGNVLTCRSEGSGLSQAGPVELFQVNGRRRIAVLGSLRLYCKFIPNARHGEDESWRPRVRLQLAPQPGHKHVDAAIVGFSAAPGNGTTEPVTR